MTRDLDSFNDQDLIDPAEDAFDLTQLMTRARPANGNENHPLIAPLAAAIEAVTRLDTLVSVASNDVAAGVRARMAFKEAAGWLSYGHVRIHERDLALRASHHTSSYSAAALRGDMRSVLPNTTEGGNPDTTPDDVLVDQSLRLAQLWPRLAEVKSWSPLSDVQTLVETVDSLAGSHNVSSLELEHWLGQIRHRSPMPALLRAAAAARSWANMPGGNPDLTVDAMFLAAAVFKQTGNGNAAPLPFWSAPNTLHYRLSMTTGQKWTVGFLECVAKAAAVGLIELARLQALEARLPQIGRSARAKLPAAIGFAIRRPVITAKSLAAGIKMTPQAASVLVNEMERMGILQEATRRKSWRAFVIK